MSLRVVFDTSSLVSAALRAGSVPQQALLRALTHCELCGSKETLAELDRVLKYAKFDKYAERSSRASFFKILRGQIQLFAITESDFSLAEGQCRDSKDTYFLALALAASASVIVSSDNDLLVLHPWQRIAIVTPRAFLSEMKDFS